jgi:hypothetical protein
MCQIPWLTASKIDIPPSPTLTDKRDRPPLFIRCHACLEFISIGRSRRRLRPLLHMPCSGATSEGSTRPAEHTTQTSRQNPLFAQSTLLAVPRATCQGRRRRRGHGLQYIPERHVFIRRRWCRLFQSYTPCWWYSGYCVRDVSVSCVVHILPLAAVQTCCGYHPLSMAFA